MIAASHPILSCDAARDLERALFGGDEAKEWPAMQRAGRALAAAVLADFREIGGFPPDSRILVLAGKGHNAGDALIAAHALLDNFPAARADVIFALGERALRPLTSRAWREMPGSATILGRDFEGRSYDLCLDGLFGFQFRPPADAAIEILLARINALPIRLRAAVDLPSAGLFRADFTYATGVAKTPLLDSPQAGRLRYLDLGFFSDDSPAPERVLTPAILSPLNALRPSLSDKRSYGHLFVLAGSRHYPGAALMAVLAALRSGVGLVTAFVPESLVPAFATSAPEAIWVGWPETPDGGLALEGRHLLAARFDRATALVLGPGLGREAETLALARDVVADSTVPVLLDADALQPGIVSAGSCARIITPHAGEWARIKDAPLPCTTVVLKGPVTRIVAPAAAYYSFSGGPVLARGGSGDLLAGLTGGLLAQIPSDPTLAASRGVAWHGRAADLLARAHGQAAVHTSQLLDFLSAALRDSGP